MPHFSKHLWDHSFEKKVGHWFNDKHDKPELTKPMPEPTKPMPELTKPMPEPTKPELTKPMPELTKPMPEPTKPMPEPTKPMPEPTKPMPELTKPMPEPTKPEPTKPMPELTKPMPEPTKPMPEPTKPEPTKPMPEPTKPMPEPTKPMPEPTKPMPEPEPTTGVTLSELETAFLKLVNEDRAKVGAKPLTADSELITAARDHSAWMDSVDTLSHTGKNGSAPSDRIEDAGYDFVRSAENVAYIAGSRADVLDLPDVVQLHTNLMNSPGHHANLMNPDLIEIGIGLKHGDMNGMAAVFVTQNFGTPTAAEASEDALGLAGISPISGTGAFDM